MTRKTRRKDPSTCRNIRYSTYVTPVLDKRIKALEAKILEEFGSINEWLNSLMEKDLKRRES